MRDDLQSQAYAIMLFALAVTIISCGGGGGTAVTGGTTSGGGIPHLGPAANMNGYRPFPDHNPWNTPIDTEPVDPNSANLINTIGTDRNLHPDFGADWNGGPVRV